MPKKKDKSGERRKLPEPVTIALPDRQAYNPSKAEMEEEFDMLGATLAEV